MFNQTVIIVISILAISLLFFRYGVRIKFVTGRQVRQAESHNQEVFKKMLAQSLEAERKRIESKRKERRFTLCSDFSDAIADLLTPHYDLKQIIEDLKHIKDRVFSAEEPFLFHHDTWEMFQMMEIADKMDTLLYYSLQTRSQKKKTSLMDEFHTLKESLQNYALPHRYGKLGEYEAHLFSPLHCEPDYYDPDEKEGEGWRKAKEGSFSLTRQRDNANRDPDCQIERMFAEVQMNGASMSGLA